MVWVGGLQSDVVDVRCASRDMLMSRKPSEALPALRQLLVTTESPNARNAAALVLREYEDEAALPLLVRLVEDPRTIGHRGTLVWAMAPFDYIDHVELLVRLLIEDGWEASQMALLLLEEAEGEVAGDVMDRCRLRLREALAVAPSQRRESISFALEMFEDSDLSV